MKNIRFQAKKKPSARLTEDLYHSNNREEQIAVGKGIEPPSQMDLDHLTL